MGSTGVGNEDEELDIGEVYYCEVWDQEEII